MELIARLINETSVNLLLVGGEAEGERLQRLAAALPLPRCVVAKNLPLVELAQRMKACRGFLGHDSGITHLAAALGLPTTVLWAHTVEEIWRPQGAHVTVLRAAGGIGGISAQQVIKQVMRGK